MAIHTVKILKDTVFKQDPVDSSKLGDEDKVSVKAGTEFTLAAYKDCDNHLLLTLNPPANIEGKNTWYAFVGHIEIDGGKEAVEIPKGASFSVQGYKFPLFFASPIYPGSNFKWSEALHYNPVTGYYRKPTKEIVNNIIDMAKRMDWVRAELGNYPIIVTSWYRDPISNARAGGASKSWHMLGKAVDFQSTKYTPEQVRAKIRSKWVGGVELGIPWNHLDSGKDRDFYP